MENERNEDFIHSHSLSVHSISRCSVVVSVVTLVHIVINPYKPRLGIVIITKELFIMF